LDQFGWQFAKKDKWEDMGFAKFIKAAAKAVAASSSPSPGKPHQSGLLGFQETGTPPQVDSGGRVIIKLKGGSPGVNWGVNRSDMDQALTNKLAGKVNEDEEFSKSIKVRIRPDTKSQFKDSILVETTDEKFIGWILKNDSPNASQVLQQVKAAVEQAVFELRGRDMTFEVSAKIEGYWNEVGEGDKEEWEADFDSMEIRIKAPAEIEVD
jgi:hypothetical protein